MVTTLKQRNTSTITEDFGTKDNNEFSTDVIEQ